MKKSFIVSYYFILQLCFSSCSAMDLPNSTQHGTMSIHDVNHQDAISGRKFIHSFIYKSFRKVQEEFTALNEPVRSLIWNYLNNSIQSNPDQITGKAGPILLFVTLKLLPIELINIILQQPHIQELNMSIAIKKNFPIKRLLESIKDIDELFGNDPIKKLPFYNISYYIDIKKQTALDSCLTKEQCTALKANWINKKDFPIIISIDNSILEMVIDQFRQQRKTIYYLNYKYKESSNYTLKKILKRSAICCLCLIAFPLTYRHYIVNSIERSCLQYPNSSALEVYNEIKNEISKIDAIKSQLQSMNISFKNSYFASPELPDVPYHYHIYDYPKLALPILLFPFLGPLPGLTTLLFYSDPEITTYAALVLNSFFYIPTIAYYYLLFDVPWTPENPALCLKVVTGSFIFFTLIQMMLEYIVGLGLEKNGFVRGYTPKALKENLINLLEDNGITIK